MDTLITQLHSGSPDLSSLAAVISAAVAFVAVLVGPFVSVHVARRQIIAPLRQQWIDNLREQVSEYVALVTTHMHLNPPHMSIDKVERLHYLESKVQLLINPNEEDHKRLVQLIDELQEVVLSTDVEHLETFDEALKLNADLISHSQKVLKKEWDRVKQLT